MRVSMLSFFPLAYLQTIVWKAEHSGHLAGTGKRHTSCVFNAPTSRETKDNHETPRDAPRRPETLGRECERVGPLLYLGARLAS